MSVIIARTVSSPPIFLAPMAGITDPPFRALARAWGADHVVSEMIASREIIGAPPSAETLGLGDPATSVQIAGADPALAAEAARLVAGAGARVIDINMGCPAKKVVGAWAGSALMRDPDAALRLIEAVVRAVTVPVTLKMRLGWDATRLTAPEIARRAEDAGITMVAVHGRTRCQFYKGQADWAAIAGVKRAVTIPVIANGDIAGIAEARRALALSGADGLMIGRAARGRPWLLGEIAAALSGREAPVRPRGAALRALVAGHYEAMLSHYGTALGVRVARKHLGWYLDAAGADPGFRTRLLTEGDPRTVLKALARPWPAAGEGRAAA
jgi:tRNA-dihydrouridine synthase B